MVRNPLSNNDGASYFLHSTPPSAFPHSCLTDPSSFVTTRYPVACTWICAKTVVSRAAAPAALRLPHPLYAPTFPSFLCCSIHDPWPHSPSMMRESSGIVFNVLSLRSLTTSGEGFQLLFGEVRRGNATKPMILCSIRHILLQGAPPDSFWRSFSGFGMCRQYRFIGKVLSHRLCQEHDSSVLSLCVSYGGTQCLNESMHASDVCVNFFLCEQNPGPLQASALVTLWAPLQ